jgi:hypothetical protein
LKTILQQKVDGYVLAVDEVLNRIVETRDIDALETLLECVDDDEDFPSVWHMLCHTLESFGVSYHRVMLKELPRLWAESPESTKTLHTRILNSKESTKEYTKLVADADCESRLALTELLLSICNENEGLEEKAAPLFEVLRSLE